MYNPTLPPTLPPASELGFYPVICLSASQCLAPSDNRHRTTHGGWEYHQGAGDDHELWGEGMGPGEWWEWREGLFDAGIGRERVEEEVRKLVAEKKKGGVAQTAGGSEDPPTPVAPTTQIYLTTLPLNTSTLSNPTIALHTYRPNTTPQPSLDPSTHLILTHRPNKDGLAPLLPLIVAFATPHLLAGRPITLACEDGKDASIGAAVVLLQLFFDGEGRLLEEGRPGEKVSKTTIAKRLHWVLNARGMKGANPSRATLKRINGFLMSSAYVP